MALFHVQAGKTCREVAKSLDVQEGAISEWIKRWAHGGLDGMQHQPGQGAQRRFNVVDVPQIKEGIIKLQEQSTGGRIRGKDVQEYLLSEWGIVYKISAVYDFLKYINLVLISSKSKHQSSNQVLQDDFKKKVKLHILCMKKSKEYKDILLFFFFR